MDVKNPKQQNLVLLPTNKNTYPHHLQNGLINLRQAIPDIPLERAKKIIESSKIYFLRGITPSAIELYAARKAVMKAKSEAGKKSSRSLDALELIIFDSYCLSKSPLMAGEVMKNYIHHSGNPPEDVLRNNVAALAYEKANDEGYVYYAKEAYERSEKISGDWEASTEYAIALMNIGNFSPEYKSEQTLDDAATLLLQSQDIINNQYSKAEKILNTHLFIPSYVLGEIEYRLGIIDKKNTAIHWKTADENFSKALDGGFAIGDLYRHLGNIKVYLEKYSEAYSCLSEAIISEPKHIDSYLSGFYALHNQGMYEEALVFLRECAIINSDDPTYLSAKKTYEDKTGLRVAFFTDNIPPRPSEEWENTVRFNGQLCLDILQTYPKPTKIHKNIMNSLSLLKQVDSLLTNGVNTNSQDSFLSLEKNLYKIKALNPNLDLNPAYISLFGQMGIYEYASDCFKRFAYGIDEEYEIKFEDNNLNNELSKMRDIMKKPFLYARHAKGILKKHPNHWAALSNLAHAFKLIALSLDGEKKALFFERSYKLYEMAENELHDYAKKLKYPIEKFKKQNSFACLPAFGMGFSRFYQYLESCRNGYPNNDYLDESERRIKEVGCLGFFNAEYFFFNGLIQKGYGNLEKSIELYNSAVNFDNEYIQPLVGLADIFISADDMSQAKECIDMASKIRPKDKRLSIIKAKYDLFAVDRD